MKRITAGEARKNWFRLLDEVAEVREVPDYSGLIGATGDAAHADQWGWDWPSEEGDLVPVDREPA